MRNTLAGLHEKNLVVIYKFKPAREPHIYEISALGDEYLRGLGR